MIFGPGGPPVYCPDEHLAVPDIHEATKVYAVFAALALADNGAAGRPGRVAMGSDGFANVLDQCLAVRPGEQVVLLTDGWDRRRSGHPSAGGGPPGTASRWWPRCWRHTCPAPSRPVRWRR